MNKFLLFSRFQLKIVLRDYKGALIGFLMPLLSFVIFGNLFSQPDADMYGGVNIVPYLIPAFTLIIIVNAVLLMFGQYYANYREQGTLLKYKLLGLSDSFVTVSIFLSTIVFQILAITLLVILGNVTQNVSIPYTNLISIGIGLVIINLYQYALSLILQALVKNSTAYGSLALLLFNFQMFLGGLTFPPEILPEFLMNVVKYCNPIYYGLIMFRGIWTDEKSILDFWQEGLILIIVTIVMIFVSYLLNKRKEF